MGGAQDGCRRPNGVPAKRNNMKGKNVEFFDPSVRRAETNE